MTSLLARRRILVVEDEMLVLMNIEMTLEDLGCRSIHSAASVAEALELLARYNFDAAMIDVNLGGEKSYPIADVLARLKIPFAFSTGYSDLGDRTDFGDRPVLRKPYFRVDLERLFAELLRVDYLSTIQEYQPISEIQTGKMSTHSDIRQPLI